MLGTLAGKPGREEPDTRVRCVLWLSTDGSTKQYGRTTRQRCHHQNQRQQTLQGM